MLNPSDVYVSGGPSDLRVCWTDKVTKYDASSFYNWEQDNLPLHDLDERTELLWERAGNPTSSITGMSFIVSAGADEGCYPFYFSTVSSCIAALPDVINYPILVEVLSFGDLGSLEIPAKTFGPNGALEIVNRNSSFAGGVQLSGAANEGFSVQSYNADYTDYSIASAVVPAGSVVDQMEAGASAPTLAFDLQNAKTLTSSIYATSTTTRYADARFGADLDGLYVFSRRVYADGDNRLTAALGSTLAPWNVAAANFRAASGLAFDAFDAPAARRTAEMDAYDTSTLNFLTKSEVKWGNGGAGETATYGAAAFAYANHLSNIKIQNCNGPIYIRNFAVDSKHSFDKGIEVLNSDVFLERCSVSRANKAGLHAENSNAVLLRGFVAYRNYELKGSTRTGIPFETKRVSYDSVSSYGVGIYANNSTINVSSTYQRDIDKATEASGAEYPSYLGDIPNPSMEALYCLSRNDIGIHAVNSNIIGGRTELNGQGFGSWTDATQIFSELNTEAGIKLENSKLDNSGRILLYGNYRGLDADDSKIATDVLKCKDNQAEALFLKNSSFTYGKETYATQAYGTNFSDESRFDQVGLLGNGTHLKCINSKVAPVEINSIPTVYSQFFTSGAFGRDNATEGTNELNGLLPSVHISDNSDAELVHFVGNRRKDFASDVGYDRAVYGSVIRVDKNSSVTTRGSHKFANIIAGADGRDNHIRQAGVFADKNSSVSFQGPTVVGSLGVDVLVDNNSKMEFVPHRNSDGELMVSAYDLSNPLNHTSVELHSTRACLVSKGNSEIVMQDLGDYQSTFANGTHGGGLPTTKFDYLNNVDGLQNDGLYRTNVSGGYIQFYPNAYIDTDGITGEGRDLGGGTPFANVAFTAYGAADIISGVKNYYLKQLTAPTYDKIDEISTGGMCVRALEGSKVNVTNVHFPAGWHNTSGQVYDLSGSIPNCTRLRIWNIADDSLVHANYTSVSGLHPVDAGYHGPSGDWGTKAAPSSTPDTSSISVLDFYGKSILLSGADQFGTNSFQNLGPFRLFFSTDPVCNWIQTSSLDANSSGFISQLFSQGYQLSANAIAGNSSNFNSSAQHFSVLRFEDQNNLSGAIVPSGYYYASDMMHNPQTTKAVLDESASNLFANAKHNSVGKSNLAKVVNIYYPYVEYPIGGDSYKEGEVGSTRGLASVNNFDLEKGN